MSVTPSTSRTLARPRGMTQYECEVARQAAARLSQDFPILPTSELDASPILPEEAGDPLTPQQRLAVAALACGQSFTVAAKAANVTRRTLYNWRQTDAFQRTLDQLTCDALTTTATRVRNLMLRATRVLAEGMVGPDAFGSAMRVANSARLWAALNAAEAKLEKASLVDPAIESNVDSPADPAARSPASPCQTA